MDEKRRFIQQIPFRTVVEHVASVVYTEEIGFVYEVEIYAEGVDPETRRVDGVARRYVSCEAFVEAVVSEDAVSAGEAAFDVFAFFVFVGEGGLGGWGCGEADVGAGGLLEVGLFFEGGG